MRIIFGLLSGIALWGSLRNMIGLSSGIALFGPMRIIFGLLSGIALWGILAQHCRTVERNYPYGELLGAMVFVSSEIHTGELLGAIMLTRIIIIGPLSGIALMGPLHNIIGLLSGIIPTGNFSAR
jgi:hypothetical protein